MCVYVVRVLNLAITAITSPPIYRLLRRCLEYVSVLRWYDNRAVTYRPDERFVCALVG